MLGGCGVGDDFSLMRLPIRLLFITDLLLLLSWLSLLRLWLLHRLYLLRAFLNFRVLVVSGRYRLLLSAGGLIAALGLSLGLRLVGGSSLELIKERGLLGHYRFAIS